jgi:hypothetical protein
MPTLTEGAIDINNAAQAIEKMKEKQSPRASSMFGSHQQTAADSTNQTNSESMELS